MGHPTCIIEGLACWLTLCILEKIIYNHGPSYCCVVLGVMWLYVYVVGMCTLNWRTVYRIDVPVCQFFSVPFSSRYEAYCIFDFVSFRPVQILFETVCQWIDVKPPIKHLYHYFAKKESSTQWNHYKTLFNFPSTCRVLVALEIFLSMRGMTGWYDINNALRGLRSWQKYEFAPYGFQSPAHYIPQVYQLFISMSI